MIAPDYLRYPKRRYGMDHDRYDWSMLPDRAPVQWPGGARVALWVTASLQWFPLNQKGVPFKPVGSLQTAYPDLRHYTLRDYGNRVGIYRIMKELRARNIPASVPINAAVAARYPSLAQACVDLGWELMGHGLDMDHVHHTGMSDEAQVIERSLDIVRRFAPVRGWLSPARSESHDTLDLLAQSGIDYVCDWVNDDMPYGMRAGGREMVAMPLCADIEDAGLLIAWHQDEDDLRQQWIDQFDYLYAESERHVPRVMALPLHAWAIGQPYRIGVLADVLDHILSKPGVWAATGGQIMDAWKACHAKA
jgi:peptidoglycan/xylan/chitin deacetylase (PgdA/CDA1 family)